MHDHNHPHEHHHDTPTSKVETVALLKYMLDHNTHHAEELHEMGHSVEGEASELIHQAVKALQDSNDKLAAALLLLK